MARSFSGQAYGRHLHRLVRLHSRRSQSHATLFFRNRAELTLLCRLLDRKVYGSSVNIAVLACSKGAEVYSIASAIRCSRPDLKIRLHAVDVSREIVEFAARRGTR
jgi:chemotaxis methyl-accepting protein methylase